MRKIIYLIIVTLLLVFVFIIIKQYANRKMSARIKTPCSRIIADYKNGKLTQAKDSPLLSGFV